MDKSETIDATNDQTADMETCDKARECRVSSKVDIATQMLQRAIEDSFKSPELRKEYVDVYLSGLIARGPEQIIALNSLAMEEQMLDYVIKWTEMNDDLIPIDKVPSFDLVMLVLKIHKKHMRRLGTNAPAQL